MISVKIKGLNELISAFTENEYLMDADVIDKVVFQEAQEFKNKLYNAYVGQSKTEATAQSVEVFKRKRKSGADPYFTYYIGPRYGGRDMGGDVGNAAHLLEFGTVERFRANTKLGGMGKKAKGKRTGLKGVYGAKISTGKMPAFGIIRKTVDANKEYLEKQIGENLLKALTKKAKELGLQSKYY